MDESDWSRAILTILRVSDTAVKKVKIVSMGCFKNHTDTERFAHTLSSCGYEQCGSEDISDLCLINTCAFIKDAIDENIAVILDAIQEKEEGRIKEIAITGCLVNRYGASVLSKELPEIDRWFAAEAYSDVARAYGSVVSGVPGRDIISSSRHVRYLKIAEGCDNHCTYCTIPSIRGGLKSLDIDFLVREAQSLCDDGAREICIVSQDPTSYGRDLGGRVGLISLLDALESSLPYDIWLRLLYLQPFGVTDTLLERIASGKQLIRYLDIPIQHASDKILRSMGRTVDRRRMTEIFMRARELMPDAVLRTTCMVGFPGETKDDHKELVNMIRETEFDRLGVFEYSPEEGTPAGNMLSQVSKSTKSRRISEIMSIQEVISEKKLSRLAGSVLDVMIDELSEDGRAEGRTRGDAPEVDGVCDVVLHGKVCPGDIIPVRVTGSSAHDIEGEQVI